MEILRILRDFSSLAGMFSYSRLCNYLFVEYIELLEYPLRQDRPGGEMSSVFGWFHSEPPIIKSPWVCMIIIQTQGDIWVVDLDKEMYDREEKGNTGYGTSKNQEFFVLF